MNITLSSSDRILLSKIQIHNISGKKVHDLAY